ncbi:hypothetical protein ACHAPU_009122 [Fusarium lateritium]
MSETEETILDFAIDVTERLATIAQGVGAGGNYQFCSALAASLSIISQQLRDRDSDEKLVARLPKLLSNLERLCKPKTSSSSREVHTSRYKKASERLVDRFPGLCQLQQDNRKNAVAAIRRFGPSQSPEAIKRQKDLLRILEAFGKPLTSAEESVVPKVKEEIWMGDDYTGSIRILHGVLMRYIYCGSGNERKALSGKLRLALESSCGSDSPAFDLMFLAHPHHESRTESLRWRETRIRVNRRLAKFRDFQEQDVSTPQHAPVRITNFCDKISTKEQYQLSLSVLDRQLYFNEWCEGARTWVPDCPSVSLHTILRNHNMSKKMKFLLSYLLARSIWQFYNTGWTEQEWTAESIHFMYEHRRNGGNAGIYLNEPFVSAHFQTGPTRDDSVFRPHKFPMVKALGIILLEIELGTVIQDYFGPSNFTDGELNDDADLHVALQLYDDPDRLEDTFPLLKAVIGECLRPGKFMSYRHSVEDLRKVLREQVVDHLHTLISLYGKPESIELRPTVQLQTPKALLVTNPAEDTVIQQESSSLLSKISTGLTKIDQRLHTKTAHPNGSVATCIGQASAEDWFDELDRLNSVLYNMPDELDDTYRRVRVAVIDTGVNGQDPYAAHIAGYKDFVDDNDAVKQDKTGHGTNSVKLIFKVHAEAEVYVARVFENDQANDNTQDLMLKVELLKQTGNQHAKTRQAINHAQQIWRADIITIASGFEKEHHRMRKAIKKAVSDGILVFAAASNYGNIRQVTFPARMQDVICVYSTDGRAKVSLSINPAPQTTKTRNFAILGEGVMIPPSTEERVTGTSVATSIAAGLAGRILDFSRQIHRTSRIRCVDNLESVDGMSAVFSHMAKGAEDNKYHCVVPGRLLQHLDEDMDRTVARERICEKLSMILENIDLDT